MAKCVENRAVLGKSAGPSEFIQLNGEIPETIGHNGITYYYAGMNNGQAYYTDRESNPPVGVLPYCKYCGSPDENGNLIVNPVCPDHNSIIKVMEEYGRKVEDRLPCLPTVDILAKINELISNPPGFDGIHCEMGHVGNKYVDAGWVAGLFAIRVWIQDKHTRPCADSLVAHMENDPSRDSSSLPDTDKEGF
jgi:hypothetical protein